MSTVKFSIVVAVDEKRGIGKDNNLPWRIPGDLKYFKETTTAAPEGKINAVIMGRKTWESIPEKFRPLPKRLNIVVSTNPSYQLPDGCLLVASLNAALEACQREDVHQTFVIGGAQLYETALESKDLKQIYLTRIFQDFECDRFFPEYADTFKVVTRSDTQHDNGIEYEFRILEPKRPYSS